MRSVMVVLAILQRQVSDYKTKAADLEQQMSDDKIHNA